MHVKAETSGNHIFQLRIGLEDMLRRELAEIGRDKNHLLKCQRE
jgi:hypothetical protein